eukprot:gene13037-1123_t
MQWDISPIERLLMPGNPPHEPIVEFQLWLHTAAITDIVFLGDDALLATSSLDGSVAVTNLEMRQIVRRLTPTNPLLCLAPMPGISNDGKPPGITCLAYSKRTGHLISGGMEFDPLCWIFNVPNSKPLALLDAMRRAPEVPAFVSLDTDAAPRHLGWGAAEVDAAL